MTRDGNEVKKVLVGCLGKEGGEATPDGLLYAYQKAQGLSRRELLKLAEECDEIEVIRQRYYAWNDCEIMIFLKLKGCGKGEAITPRGRRAEEENDPQRPIKCSRCG